MSTPLRKPEPEPSGVTIVTTSVPREIRIERIFKAPRDLVWRAFTEPDLVAQWWGRGNKLDIERFELERGGRWRFVEHGPEGTTGFEGTFLEVTPQDRLVQTFGWDGMPDHEATDTAELEDLGDGRTKVVTTSRFETKEERDAMIGYGMEKGLNQSYEALDRLLTQLV